MRWIVFVVGCFFSVGVVGCGSAGDSSNTNTNTNNTASKDYSTTLKTKSEAYVVSYGEIRDSEGKSYEKIPFNKIFSMVVTVKSGGGEAAALGEAPSVDAMMPEHQHGMNTKPVVENQSPGVYKVTGMLFHMPGLWTLTVTFPGDGGASESVTFNVMQDAS